MANYVFGTARMECDYIPSPERYYGMEISMNTMYYNFKISFDLAFDVCGQQIYCHIPRLTADGEVSQLFKEAIPSEIINFFEKFHEIFKSSFPDYFVVTDPVLAYILTESGVPNVLQADNCIVRYHSPSKSFRSRMASIFIHNKFCRYIKRKMM